MTAAIIPILSYSKAISKKANCHLRCALKLGSGRYHSSTNTTEHVISSQQKSGNSLSRILTDEQRLLFNKVNQLSNKTRSLAKQVGNVEIKQDSILRRSSSIESADNAAPLSTFTVVFAGEFNSGKSTLINALLGDEIQEVGVLPTTDAITIIMANNDSDAKSKHDDKDSGCSSSSNLIEGLDTGITNVHTQLHLLPTQKYPILSDLCLLDTPGTNAILSLQHTSSTLRILHDADLIVFVIVQTDHFQKVKDNYYKHPSNHIESE